MITLTSDFGSPYPAAMKGVLLQRSDARLVDIAHDLPRQDVRAAAFWLREVLPYFPPATHLVVVDPGVGTERAAILVRAGDHWLVGPDNGVLLPAARRLAGRDEGPDGTDGSTDDENGGPADDENGGPADDDGFDVFDWRYADPESSTFHGRDVFAPAAAAVHDADGPRALDPVESADGFVDLAFPEPDVREGGAIGEVLVVDGFGNVITNVPGDVLDGLDDVRVNGQSVPADRAYARVDVGQWLATVGSHGNVELAVNQGRGDEAFGLAAGDDVALEW